MFNTKKLEVSFFSDLSVLYEQLMKLNVNSKLITGVEDLCKNNLARAKIGKK